jgi:hypothetical protein
MGDIGSGTDLAATAMNRFSSISDGGLPGGAQAASAVAITTDTNIDRTIARVIGYLSTRRPITARVGNPVMYWRRV